MTSYYFKTFSANVKQKRGNVYTNGNILFIQGFSEKKKKKGNLWGGGGLFYFWSRAIFVVYVWRLTHKFVVKRKCLYK